MPRSPSRKLTRRIIDETPLPPEGPIRLWDGEVKKLFLRSWPSGVRTWYAAYRTASGQQRTQKLGSYSSLTPDEARNRARVIDVAVQDGKDPAAERLINRKENTVSQLASEFLANHVNKLKPSTAEHYKSLINLYVVPEFGSCAVASLTTAQLQRWHSSFSDRPWQGNRAIAVFQSMLSKAVEWGLRDDNVNPAVRVKRYRENPKNRYVTDAEVQRLVSVLNDEAKSNLSDAALAIWLLLVTGRRRGEILGLRWDCVDLDNERIRLPDSKVGVKTYALPRSAVEALRTAQQRQKDEGDTSEYVIRGRVKGQPLKYIQAPWERIRKKSGLEDVRLHDLRHTFASRAAAHGVDLLTIKKMLGHNNIQTTMRYADLTDQMVKRRLDEIDVNNTPFNKPE